MMRPCNSHCLTHRAGSKGQGRYMMGLLTHTVLMHRYGLSIYMMGSCN